MELRIISSNSNSLRRVIHIMVTFSYFRKIPTGMVWEMLAKMTKMVIQHQIYTQGISSLQTHVSNINFACDQEVRVADSHPLFEITQMGLTIIKMVCNENGLKRGFIMKMEVDCVKFEFVCVITKFSIDMQILLTVDNTLIFIDHL